MFNPEDDFEPRRPRCSGLSMVFWYIFFAWTVMMYVLLAVGVYDYADKLDTNRRNIVIRMVDWYSPLHDQVQIDLVDRTINGSLLDMDHSLFRAPPSPEVDAAWARVGSLWPHVISTEDVVSLGKDPSMTARWPEDWGFGSDAHVAELDVFHTIHCLNAIRRDVHWRHYYMDKYPDGVFPELHRIHTNHCLYIVLQNLMCSATADIVTNTWMEGQLHPFPDFAVNKVCRNFDAILDWHESNAVRNMTKYAEMRMPQGHEPYRMPEEFHRAFNTGLENPFEEHGHDHREAGMQ